MGDDSISKILRFYGLQSGRLLGPQKGYRNESHPVEIADRRQFNLIIYKSEPEILPRIRRANTIADFLAIQNFPARKTADHRIVVLSAGPATKRYASLYNYLPGNTIPWEAYTMQHLKALGSTMSTMHYFMRDFSGNIGQDVADEYEAILKRMTRYFLQTTVTQALRTKLHITVQGSVLAKLETILHACKRLPNQQPLHMDFVRGNILFDKNNQISGVLDFEKTAQGHPLFDLARTLAFLLVDCKYKSEQAIRKYFLHSGYNKRGTHSFKVTARNTKLLEELINLFLLHDFYKFLRHNPYESLPQNEHFVRTCDILQSRQLLTSARIRTTRKGEI